MSAGFSFDDQILEIACPTCGKKIKEKVRWFKQEGHACPHGCGTVFKPEKFRRGIKEAEKSIADLGRKIGNIKIKL